MTTDGIFTANDGNEELEPPSDRYVALHTKDRNWSSQASHRFKMIARNLTLGHSSNRGTLLQPVVTVNYVPIAAIEDKNLRDYAGPSAVIGEWLICGS